MREDPDRSAALSEGATSVAEREALLTTILESAPVGLVLMDAETFVVREANSAYHKFLEGEWRTSGSILGLSFSEFIPGFEELGVADLFRQVRDTGEAVEITEYEFHGFERGVTYFRWTLKPLELGSDSQPKYLLLLVVEITEQVLARQAIDVERQALFSVLDSIPVGVIVAEAPSGKIAYLNPAAVRLGGRSPEELNAASIAEYTDRWRPFRPTGAPFPPDELPLARAVRGEGSRNTEMVLEMPDGSRRTVMVSGVPLLDVNGQVTRGVVVFYDVTERLRLERELRERTADAERSMTAATQRAEENRALVAAAEVLASTLDPEEVMERIVDITLDLTAADGAGLTILAGKDADRIRMPVARGILGRFQGTETTREGSITDMVIGSGEPQVVDREAIPAGHANREVFERLGIEYFAALPLQAGEERLGALGVARSQESGPFPERDIRVLSLLANQAALAVRNARLFEAAQQASRTKSDFLAMMSHELRTPLNALEGYGSLLEDRVYGPLTEQQEEALQRMRLSRKHLVALIEQVLDVARVEAGRKEPHPAMLDLGALVSEIGEALDGAALAKGLTLDVSINGVGEVHTDEAMVRQILTNLIGNAIKFTDEGVIRVAVRRADNRLVIEVSDTGIGINPEDRERIFEPFVQVDSSITRKEGGSGLGLALSREFARLLGGEVRMQSEPGQGSTFTFELPIQPPAQP